MKRLILLVEGDPSDLRNFSGIPYHFSQALRRSLDRIGVVLLTVDTSYLLNVEEMLDPALPDHKLRFAPNRELLGALGEGRVAALPDYYAAVEHHLDQRIAAIAEPSDVLLSQNYLYPYLGTTRPIHYFLDAVLTDFYFGGPHSTVPDVPGRDQAADFFRTLERDALVASPHIFCFSAALREDIRDQFAVPPDRLTVVGAGPNVIAPGSLDQPRDPTSPLRLLFVGRDFRRKGGYVLLEALARISEDISLTIVTDEVRLPRTSDPRVTFRTEQSSDQLCRLYRDSDVLVLPTLLEPYGLVLLEAMSFGLPVIAAQTYAVPEILGTTSFPRIVRAGDPDHLAAAIRKVASDRELVHHWGVANFLRARHRFGWDRCADLIVETIWNTATK